MGEVDEERRLFYVGMSRARERLYLLRARRRVLHGRNLRNSPSRFLADIEEKLKQYDRQRGGAKRKKEEESMQLGLFPC